MGLFKKNNSGEKVITKTAKQAAIEKEIQETLEKEKRTCPECGSYDPWNKTTIDYELRKGRREFFECQHCGCQWQYISKR